MTIEELMSNYKESHTAVRKHNKNKAEGTVLTIKKQRIQNDIYMQFTLHKVTARV